MTQPPAAADAARRPRTSAASATSCGRCAGRKVALMLALGFSSGLPFMLIGNTLGFWLADDGVKLAAIGFLSWVGPGLLVQVHLGRGGRPPAGARSSARSAGGAAG